MTTNCDFYGVSCDQCIQPDDECRTYLPGIAGFCYRYSNTIAAFVQNLLPLASGAYGLTLAAKKVLPATESNESWFQYAGRVSSSACSTLRSGFEQAKETISPRRIANLASQSLSWVKKNPGKIAATTASAVLPRFVPAILQMPAITGLALGTLATIQYGNEWFAALKDLVTIRPEETEEEFKSRKRLYLAKTAVSIAGLAGFGAVLRTFIPEIIQKSTTYNIWLPLQTPATAFIEYNPLVLAHGLLGLRDGKNGKKLSAVYHTLSALSTLAFPSYIAATHQPLRLHHFWIGQFFQALPSLSAKLFGLFLSIDGWVQIITQTGYQNYNYGNWDESSYGCDNVTMDHFDAILFAGSLALLLDGASKILFSQSKPEDLSIWQSVKSVGRRAYCCRRVTGESAPLLDASNQTDNSV